MEQPSKPVEPDRPENDGAVEQGETSEESSDSARGTPPPVAIEQSINDAAKGVNAVWITLILLMIYSVISTGKISHKDLFLETPVKLPLLSVDVPLQAYFLLLPLLILAVHLYFAIQLFGLASKFDEYDYVLPTDIAGERSRLRLHNSPFVEILGGPRGLFSRTITAFEISNRLIAWSSAVAAPALVLFYIQLMYLPQQDRAPTAWHRFALLVDVVLTLLFIVRPLARRSFPGAPYVVRAYLLILVAALPFACLLFLSAFIAVFPGEGPFPSITSRWLSRGADMVRHGPAWWFSNRLVLSDLNFNEGVDPAKTTNRRSVRGRNLSLGLFDRSDLRFFDFTGASLSFASLKGANLQGSIFSCAYSAYPQDQPENYVRGGCTDLRAAVLDEADLRGISAIGVILHGASLKSAHLDLANFSDAQLQGADLSFASLVGADFSRSGMDGALLQSAVANGANFAEAQLRGADLTGAELMGAVLTYALAQDATFARVQLQGASMPYAHFEGADFVATAVYGADIQSARFEGARIANVLMERRASVSLAIRLLMVGFRIVIPLENAEIGNVLHLPTIMRSQLISPHRSILRTTTRFPLPKAIASAGC
jgi:uncharacterized protein YjbI with pentapeptide repeats